MKRSKLLGRVRERVGFRLLAGTLNNLEMSLLHLDSEFLEIHALALLQPRVLVYFAQGYSFLRRGTQQLLQEVWLTTGLTSGLGGGRHRSEDLPVRAFVFLEKAAVELVPLVCALEGRAREEQQEEAHSY